MTKLALFALFKDI